jgi:hypothetical protein
MTFKKVVSYVFSLMILSVIALLAFRPIISFSNGAFLLTLSTVAGLILLVHTADKEYTANWKKSPIVLSASVFGLLITLWLLNWLLRFDVWQASSYQTVLGEVHKNSSFEKDIHEAKKEQMIVFDELVARTIGEKVLGSETTLGSQAELGTFVLQNVGGKFYWVAPLVHSGFFKYWSNADEGTPGYVKVSANDDQDVELVTQVKGKKLHLVYQTGSYFMKNLYNYLYFQGYSTYKIDQPEFEIDDEGNPFWVIPISKKHFASKVLNVDKLLILNPANGDIKEYTSSNVPKWVDRIYTPEILVDQVDWWGEYVHGYWNFAHRDIMVPSGEMVMVYGKEGHCMWYQGMTSKGLDNATVGFLLIDSKDKKVNFYKRVGATETAAMQSAEGKVQEKGYTAGHPTAYNISGQPTYLVPLHDKSNLVKSIALVNIHDFNHLTVATNLSDALRDYSILMSDDAMRKSGNSLSKKMNAKVLRVSSFTKAGVTSVALLIDGHEKLTLFGDPMTLTDLLFVNPNDSIHVEFMPVAGQTFGNITELKNLSIK